MDAGTAGQDGGGLLRCLVHCLCAIGLLAAIHAADGHSIAHASDDWSDPDWDPKPRHIRSAEALLGDLGGGFGNMSARELNCSAKMLLTASRLPTRARDWRGGLPEKGSGHGRFEALTTFGRFLQWDEYRHRWMREGGSGYVCLPGEDDSGLRLAVLPALMRAGLVELDANLREDRLSPNEGAGNFTVTAHGRRLMLAYESQDGGAKWQDAVPADRRNEGGAAPERLPLKPSTNPSCP